MFRQFMRDPNYLTKYHLVFGAGLLAINAGLLAYRDFTAFELLLFLPAIWFGATTDLRVVLAAFIYSAVAAAIVPGFSFAYLAFLPVAVILALVFMPGIHNPSHDSLRPKWLNRPIGELSGLCQMNGYPDWKIIHVFHHQHSDDPVLDPHPTLGKPYWEFAKGMRQSVLSAFLVHYYRIHGDNALSRKRIVRFALATRFDMLMRASFWFLALGPQAFAYLFMASISFKMFHYAWFNWSTHQYENGEPVLRNRDGGVYSFLNFFMVGTYYHANHHLQPSLANPKHMKPRNKTEDAAA